LNEAAMHFWPRSDVLSKKVRKLPSCQSASHNALTVMPCRPLSGLGCRRTRQRVNEPGYIRIAIIIL
jgi:hypothetical protein